MKDVLLYSTTFYTEVARIWDRIVGIILILLFGLKADRLNVTPIDMTSMPCATHKRLQSAHTKLLYVRPASHTRGGKNVSQYAALPRVYARACLPTRLFMNKYVLRYLCRVCWPKGIDGTV